MSQHYVFRSKSTLTYRVSATADTTTTSGTDALINSMTITPVAGTYDVSFGSSMVTNSAGALINASLYVGGIQIAATIRSISPFDGGLVSSAAAGSTMDIADTISVNGTQTIEVRWNTNGGTATCHQRILKAIKI